MRASRSTRRTPRRSSSRRVGHLWNDSAERGLFKTSDGGKTWQKILYVNASTGCADVAIDPKNPKLVYAAMWDFRRRADFFRSGGPGSGLYKSADGGAHWKRIVNGIPGGELGRIAIAIAPSRPETVYATIESSKTALYRSDDSGESWRMINTSFNVGVRPFYFSHLAVDPRDPERVYKPGFMLTMSEDGGKSFSGAGFNFGSYHSDTHAFWIDPANSDHLMLGTDGGVYVSWDRGGRWMFLRTLPVSQPYRVALDEAQPYNVYGGFQDNGCWYGPSSGGGGIGNDEWKNFGFGDGMYAFPDPTDANVIFWEYQGGEIYKFFRKTKETKQIRPYPSKSGQDPPVQLGVAVRGFPGGSAPAAGRRAVPLRVDRSGRVVAADFGRPDDRQPGARAAGRIGRSDPRRQLGGKSLHDLRHRAFAPRSRR